MKSRLRSAALALSAALACSALMLPAQTGAASSRARLAAGRLAAGRLAAGRLLGGLNVVGLDFNSVPSEADRSIAVARAVRAKVVRAVIPWAVFEPRQGAGPDARALAFTDQLATDAAAAGIKVIMTVERTPCWASSAPASLLRKCRPGATSRANAYPPKSPASYAAFLAYLAARYGNKLAALEVWSEPDQTNEQYFAGPAKVSRYAALLRAAYPAIKAAAPTVPVLGGSLTGSNGLFLKALYAAGVKGYYDGLSVHYYNLTLASVRSIREVQLAAGDDRPIWLDEFGWSSCWPRERIQQEQGCVTPAVQARNVRDTYRALARAPYVAAAIVYKLQDSRREDFGVLSSSGLHKPAFAALASSLASPLGPISPVRLALAAATAT
ncbi:MAG: glycoside hydrolase 5 family protein [Solirubrobacteraceae bacterium]